LFVTYDGHAKLLDFGIAKLASSRHTQPNNFKGKLGYAAPERFLGRPSDRRSDVFAAGVTLWETIALRRLSSGPPTRAFLEARLSGREPSIAQVAPHVDPELAEICHHAMHSDPEQRFASADALRRALQSYLSKRNGRMEPASMGKLMQKTFGGERNALHRRINTFLQTARDTDERASEVPPPAASDPAPSGPVLRTVSTFIRRRPMPAKASADANAGARPARRRRGWLLAVWLLALLALALQPELAKLGFLLE
jgi:serine/threonine-protein kinase